MAEPKENKRSHSRSVAPENEPSAQLQFVDAPKDDIREDDWWQTEKGTYTYLSEYLKFAYYVLRY